MNSNRPSTIQSYRSMTPKTVVFSEEIYFPPRIGKKFFAMRLFLAHKEIDFRREGKKKREADWRKGHEVKTSHSFLQVIMNRKNIFQATLVRQGMDTQRHEKILPEDPCKEANNELNFRNKENEKSAVELIIANKELAFQHKEKKERAYELLMANQELTFQNLEKEKRAAELIIAYKELAYQHEEKEKRAEELIIANKELTFQNQEKEKRAAELIIANKELAYQNEEKEKRAEELIVANKELAYQNEEKEKRAHELGVANKELEVQNQQKEMRAALLLIANKELAFQNAEKEKRAEELFSANKELEQFAYIASHDLQEPLRTVSNYITVFEEDYQNVLDTNAHQYLLAVKNATKRMNVLIKCLLDFSRLGNNKTLALIDCRMLAEDVLADLSTLIDTTRTTILVGEMPHLHIFEIELRQVFQNLIANAIKFQKKDALPHISITAKKMEDGYEFCFKDNGIGISHLHFQRVFDLFQRLHKAEQYEGCGIGLAYCKKIIQLHHGKIWVESVLGEGTSFYFTIPTLSL